MPYHCPRCNNPVRRGMSKAAGFAGGALGALLYSAFGEFQCKRCGPIAKSEFPADVQRKMLIGSIAIIAFVFALVLALAWLLAYVQR